MEGRVFHEHGYGKLSATATIAFHIMAPGGARDKDPPFHVRLVRGAELSPN